MVTIEKDRLIIEMGHPEPEELLKDLQDALLTSLRALSTDAGHDIPALDGRELRDASLPLLDFLQAIIIDVRT